MTSSGHRSAHSWEFIPRSFRIGVAIALGLLSSVCFCIALSTGQLPPQTVHPVRIATLIATGVAPLQGDVSFAKVLRAF